MATQKTQSLSQMNAELSGLQKQMSGLSSKIGSKSSFYGSSGTPTASDAALDVQQRDLKTRIDKLSSNITAQRMYGPKVAGADEETKPKEQGLIMKGLDVLSRPLYAVVGATQWATGKSNKGLGETVVESAKQKQTFGTLLRNSGASPSVSLGLGFALDIIADPVNLMTGGAAGLERSVAGKVVKGAAKEGLEGATLAAKGSFLTAASKVAKATGLTLDRKVAREVLKAEKAGIKLVEGSPEFARAIKSILPETKTGAGRAIQAIRLGATKLGERATEAKKAYDRLLNFNAADLVDSRADRISVTEKLRNFVEDIPGVDKVAVPLNKFLDYDSNAWSERMRLYDNAQHIIDTAGGKIRQVYNPVTKRMESPPIKTIENILDGLEAAPQIYSKPIVSSTREAENVIGKMIEDASDVMSSQKYSKASKIANSQNVKVGLEEEAINNAALKDAMRVKEEYEGIIKESQGPQAQWLSRKINNAFNKVKFRNIEIGKAIITALDNFNGLFTKMKISSLSPSSMVSATVGNPFMAWLYGINILHRNFKKSLLDSASIIFNGLGGLRERGLKSINWLNSPELKNFLERRGITFIDTFGIDPSRMGVGTLSEQLVDRASSVLGKGDNVVAKEDMLKFLDEIGSRSSAIKKALSDIKPYEYYSGKSVGEAAGQIGRETTSISSLSNYEGFMKTQEAIRKAAAEGNRAAKMLQWAFDRSADFQKIDQTYKLGSFINLVHYGIPEKDLLRMTNNFVTTNARIRKSDILSDFWKDGEHLFRLSPDKAMEIVNDIYMNYAAMPDFVRTLRSLKIVGAPFFAFTYAMLQKTGKAFANNPAALNRISFLMQEIAGEKGPTERKALESKYYSWFNNPGMLRLGENIPFFKGRPVYLNVAQMVPYLSLNITQPSERNFDDNIRGKIADTIDRAPIFKTPVGQVLLDYLILPGIISDGMPKNMWGGPLYPQDTSGLAKTGYAFRSLAEALTPGFVEPVSLPLAATGISDKATSLLPSYPLRKSIFAVQGKSPVGVIGSEDAASRGIRDFASQIGIKLYPMDLRPTITEIKKRSK